MPPAAVMYTSPGECDMHAGAVGRVSWFTAGHPVDYMLRDRMSLCPGLMGAGFLLQQIEQWRTQAAVVLINGVDASVLTLKLRITE